MRSNYKKLGPYIREVIEKNVDLSVQLLLGVSVSKEFIPSIANIIGTDMSTYKIVRKDQFAYGPVTSRNSDKISIALLSEDLCIVSTSYTAFEITDHNTLLPEYLMMWFRRPEFDRYARFKSHGSVRELFDWDEMCDVELPMPSIEKQREIVKEYHTIVGRIKLNERLNQKLEETVQAIYKQWFVDFEFPISAEYAIAIGKPELEGQSYKFCDGKMVYNDVLKQEIPEGWEVKKLSEVSTVIDNRGKTPPYENNKTQFPLIEIASLKSNGRIVNLAACSKFLDIDTYSNWFRSGHPKQKDILFSTVGSLAQLKLFWGNNGSIAQNIVAFRCTNNLALYVFQYLINKTEDLLSYEIGSVQASIKVSNLVEYKFLVPLSGVDSFDRITTKLAEKAHHLALENYLLEELYNLCLVRLAKQ